MSIEVVKIKEKARGIVVTAYASDEQWYEGNAPLDRVDYLSTSIRFRAFAAYGENAGDNYTERTVKQALDRMFTLLKRNAPHYVERFLGNVLDDIEDGSLSGFIGSYVEDWLNAHSQEV